MSYTPMDGFPYYYSLVEKVDCKSLFVSQTTFNYLLTIDEEKTSFRYAPDKWSIKQILGHITDHERIKMFRAFLLSRKEDVELWGYDQNALVENSRFEELSWIQLMDDFRNVRSASISFIDTLSKDQLNIKGRARQYEITLHHIEIMKDRYF